jgi:hypothetical protein
VIDSFDTALKLAVAASGVIGVGPWIWEAARAPFPESEPST